MSAPEIPYRSLVKTALLTIPLLAVGFVGPIFIAAGLEARLLLLVLPAVFGICTVAWALNLAFLRLRHRLGRWRWLQIFIIGGSMIGLSGVMALLFHDNLPPQAERLTAIRYVNAFAVNAIIYVIIDLRLLSETKARLAEENAQLRLSQVETQYQALKDQLNPHFLFNALGTARALARRDPALTEAYLIRLSDFLRVTLQDPPDHVPLETELKLVRDYVELQQMRFQEALVFDCAPDLTAAPYKVPFFALLTLVENAVKHNAMRTEAPLHIRVTRTGDRIHVWNNRQAKALHSPTNGSGLPNLQKRCRILGHGELRIDAAEDHFEVSFQLLPA